MATLDEILEKTTHIQTRVDSYQALFEGVKVQLRDALANANLSPANQAKVDKVMDNLTASAADIDEAITANTPPVVETGNPIP